MIELNNRMDNRLKRNGWSKNGFGLESYVTNLKKKLCKCVELHFNKPWKSDYGNNMELFPLRKKESSSATGSDESSLENQLRPWKDNPTWADHPPLIKIDVPKGSFCKLNLEVNVGLPPEAVYNLLIDSRNKRVFRHIKEVTSRKVLFDDGSRQVVDLEQAAIWRFLGFSGTVSVHVLVDQDREDYTMKYEQISSRFMRRFEGCWKVEPIFVDEELCHPLKPNSLMDYVTYTKGRGRIGSKASLEQVVQLSIAPPVLNWYLGGITAKNIGMLVDDLLAEAARIRGDSRSEFPDNKSEGKASECEVDGLDIKQRWALRRKNARHRRKLSLTSNSPW